MRPVLAVVGPTASGKTRLAVELARALGGEIVSADAMQIYQGMEIGTAAPTPEERVAAPHHMVGCVSPNTVFSAGDYQQLARKCISEIQGRGAVALVAGGAGLYVRALLDGLFDGPPRDQTVRQRLRGEAEAHGNAALMARLRAVDPEYAATLSSENDLVRIVRALEVFEVTGTPFSRLHALHRERRAPVPALQVGLSPPREELYHRINMRVDAMVVAGWVDEVRALMDRGLEAHLERIKALGYREIAACLRGEQSLPDALEAVKMHHRRYAKRQLSWFRADKRIVWLDGGPGANPLEQALGLWREFSGP